MPCGAASGDGAIFLPNEALFRFISFCEAVENISPFRVVAFNPPSDAFGQLGNLSRACVCIGAEHGPEPRPAGGGRGPCAPCAPWPGPVRPAGRIGRGSGRARLPLGNRTAALSAAKPGLV